MHRGLPFVYFNFKPIGLEISNLFYISTCLAIHTLFKYVVNRLALPGQCENMGVLSDSKSNIQLFEWSTPYPAYVCMYIL